MLTEKQVRARIKACKDEIKWQKIYLNCKINDNESYRYAKAEIRYQKAKLKLLRRELPMQMQLYYNDPVYELNCPICQGVVSSYNDYCPHCGQRVRE